MYIDNAPAPISPLQSPPSSFPSRPILTHPVIVSWYVPILHWVTVLSYDISN
ncbi:hypothetical protein L211DRAFT_844194 [Terfezia boudieri ATCC MYA-4762]|uniref:Uncharacterized protein n=1 Tax=Terfezia boudieri ATCC MYA-4762 TaxID=1051890 RepID=A0A3N4L934_9PEZI|nr:hypothetical protein L211DRAFT_844194 [Terfezia boudieri ATCC MYA-4762]